MWVTFFALFLNAHDMWIPLGDTRYESIEKCQSETQRAINEQELDLGNGANWRCLEDQYYVNDL